MYYAMKRWLQRVRRFREVRKPHRAWMRRWKPYQDAELGRCWRNYGPWVCRKVPQRRTTHGVKKRALRPKLGRASERYYLDWADH